MLVRYFWPQCDFHNGTWVHDAQVSDAVWLECTEEEAKQILPQATQEPSAGFGSAIHPNTRGYCFLVHTDLSSIQPMNTHYPFANLWNGYSPFRECPSFTVQRLIELKDRKLQERD